jgi:dTDP-4-dehydrorhamnose reductase
MKYLLTGGSGVLGTELQKHLGCFTPSHGDMDITWPAREMSNELWSQGIRAESVRAIIHCAAFTDVPGSEANRRSVVEANIIGTRNVKELAKIFHVPMIYISSDYVFRGDLGGYRETDQTDPVNYYGITKLVGEVFLNIDNDLILRTSFKPNDLWINRYDCAFIDLYSSADYTSKIAPRIAFAIYKGLTGVYHIATERKSIYELAYQTNPKVKKINIKDVVDSVRMPRDISLNTDKFSKFITENMKEFEDFLDG